MTQLPRTAPGGAVRPTELWTAIRRALCEVMHADPHGFAPLPGARVALGVLIALLFGRLSGDPGAEAAMAAGALLAGIPSVVTSNRTSLGTPVAVTLSMALSTFVGSASGEIGWLHTAVLIPWCLIGALLMGLGSAPASVGTQGIAAIIVFGQFAEPPSGALHLGAYVLAGGAIATVVLGLTRAPVTSGAQRRSLAAALDSLAAFANPGGVARNGVASAEMLDTADELLRKALFVDDEEGLALRALLDIARRARLELLAIEGRRRQVLRLGATDMESLAGAVDMVLGEAGAAFSALAGALRSSADIGGAPARFAEALRRARRLFAVPTSGAADEALAEASKSSLEAHLGALAGQLRAAADLVHRVISASPPRLSRRHLRHAPRTDPPRGARDALDTLRAHGSLRSPIGRHALRLAVVVTAAEILARHSPLERGYWVALTASVVLRPDFAITFSRGLARMLGTSVGVILAGLLAVALGSNNPAEIVAIALLCAAACSTFQVSYASFTCFLTGTVVLLVALVSQDTYTTALARLFDTLIGGTLALVAYTLWPTWSQRRAPQAFSALAARQRSYVRVLLATISGITQLDPDELWRLAREARRAKADADDALARSVSEPEGRRFNLAHGQGILAALSRIGLANHALRADLEAGRLSYPVPELATFADACSEALDLIAEQLASLAAPATRQGKTPLAPPSRTPTDTITSKGCLPPLRPSHDALTVALEGRAGLSPLLAGTDELVDAINTLSGLLGLTPAARSPDRPIS